MADTPGKPPIDRLLATWLAANCPEMGWVADLVAYANQRLETYGRPIGPSFFLRPDFNEQWLRRVWKHSVLPYLSEVLESDELDQFELRTLQASLQHDEPGQVDGP